MVYWCKVHPLFCSVQNDIREVCENHEKAKDELIARDPVKYNKTMFRAFLHLSRKEVEQMSIRDYLDYQILLKETLLLIHAPYNKSNI